MTKTTKTILWLIVAIIIIGGIWYEVSRKPAEEKAIKIGAILPLTGNMSLLGEEVKNGISLAVEDINLTGERKIEILYEDSKMDPKEGISAVNKFIDIDGVNYVYAFGTPIINAVRPITEPKKIVLAGVSIDPAILENANYTLRIFYNLNQALDKFTDFINSRKFLKIATIYLQNEAIERQIKGLEERGIKFVIKEKFNMGEKDFRTPLLKIKETNPDLIILLGYGTHFPNIFRQIEELGLKETPILGGLDFLEVPAESTYLYENVVFVAPSFNIEPTEKANVFIQKYKSRFNSRPTHQAAYAYDTITLLYYGIKNTDASSQQVISYLKSLRSYDGVVGQIEILPDGNSGSSLSLATYKNGEVAPYKE